MNERILITGGAGFIGSHLTERLLRTTDATLTLIDNFDPFYPRKAKERNLAAIGAHARLRFVERDLRDASATAALYDEVRPTTVFHIAAKAGVRPSIEDPIAYESTNLAVTTQLLRLAGEHGTRQFVFASSSSVYGNNPSVPFRETDTVDHPISPYAATKKAGELLAYTFHHLYRFNVACLRFFTVYGPRQRPDLAIHKFARRILAGDTLPVFGDGKTARDYTYIDDIIDGVVGCWNWLQSRSEPTYDIFNLGSSEPIKLADMITAIEQATECTARIERLPLQAGDVYRTFADTSYAKSCFGYAPQTPFADGLRVFVDWLRSQP